MLATLGRGAGRVSAGAKYGSVGRVAMTANGRRDGGRRVCGGGRIKGKPFMVGRRRRAQGGAGIDQIKDNNAPLPPGCNTAVMALSSEIF